MTITQDQNLTVITVKNKAKNEALFVCYEKENRCNRCFYAYRQECEEVPCTSEERKDRKTGYWRACFDNKKEIKIQVEL